MRKNKCFTVEEQRDILGFVRLVIAAEFAPKKEAVQAPECQGKLNRNGACFVTLHDYEGKLSGCIGNIIAFEPLKDNLRRNALNAAFNDPRFPVMQPDEFEETQIEVSILTEPVEISSLDEFELGRHGIILRCGDKGAVFLPQVPIEQCWDRETTLKYLCLKANLPPERWRDGGVKLSVFEAEVFGEPKENKNVD